MIARSLLYTATARRHHWARALACIVVFSMSAGTAAADAKANPRSETYLQLQRQLARGWNTWNTNSFLSHVTLPEGFAVSLGIKPRGVGATWLGDALRSNQRREQVKLGARTTDGRYTSLDVAYKGSEMRVQTGTDGEDLLMLITAKAPAGQLPASLVVDAGLLWGRPGTLTREGDHLIGKLPHRTITVGTTAPLVAEAHAPLRTPYIAMALDGEIGIFTGKSRSLAQIKAVLARNQKALTAQLSAWKELKEPFAAMQTVLAWNSIYDPENDRVISPVSRTWSIDFGGFVLFDWDTYFAAFMYGIYDKALAYANAVEITKSITPKGFIPNYTSAYGQASFDRSQPPVGSRIIRELYRKYKDRWLLDEVYDELLTWNRWWPKARGNGQYLSWGTDNVPKTADEVKQARQLAKFESGLDNAPMFDGVPLKPGTGMFELADVGLMSLYVMDCDALADIATTLNRPDDVQELKDRAETYRKSLRTLWDEGRGLFLDKRTDTGATVARLTPTHFYPLLARAATPEQAARMMKEHYFNPHEFHGEYVIPSAARNDDAFKDNDYWRGRIWAPMNFLVYLGMRNYGLARPRKDLVERSRALLMKSWRESGAIYENYNGTTGVGGDVKNADAFYHWGALLVAISFIEQGHMQAPEGPMP